MFPVAFEFWLFCYIFIAKKCVCAAVFFFAAVTLAAVTGFFRAVAKIDIQKTTHFVMRACINVCFNAYFFVTFKATQTISFDACTRMNNIYSILCTRQTHIYIISMLFKYYDDFKMAITQGKQYISRSFKNISCQSKRRSNMRGDWNKE